MASEQDEFDFSPSRPVGRHEGDSGVQDHSEASARTDRSPWREVPQALFLSWSDVRQRSYCVARDEDAALSANDPTFYLQRARMYRGL